MNSGRLLTTSNKLQTECQVALPDSCMPMMLTTLWLNGLWPYLQDLCLLACKPLSRWSVCWYGFSGCPLWPDSQWMKSRSSTSNVNGGLTKADSTRCTSHLGIIRRCTECSSLNALMSRLMCESAAGSYFQWLNTEATDVRCDMMVDGSNPSLNKCMR